MSNSAWRRTAELLIRGANVMAGYYKLPEETALTIDPEGWLRTGDIGEADAGGWLRIIDRKRDLIITSGGKNVAPAPLERQLASRRFVLQALVVGDRRSYLTALLSVDPEATAHWARVRGSFPGAEQLEAMLRDEVDAVNGELPRYRQIKRFTVVPEFTAEAGLLTPTAKQRRRAIEDRYQREIEAMYARGRNPSIPAVSVSPALASPIPDGALPSPAAEGV